MNDKKPESLKLITEGTVKKGGTNSAPKSQRPSKPIGQGGNTPPEAPH